MDSKKRNIIIADSNDVRAAELQGQLAGSYNVIMVSDGEELLKKSKESIIIYKFIPQAFLNAYMRAYSTTDKVYLVSLYGNLLGTLVYLADDLIITDFFTHFGIEPIISPFVIVQYGPHVISVRKQIGRNVAAPPRHALLEDRNGVSCSAVYDIDDVPGLNRPIRNDPCRNRAVRTQPV